jgi:hypothetical protein
MLKKLNPGFAILAHEPAATAKDVDKLVAHFGDVPADYLELVQTMTEVEFEYKTGQYLRIWSPSGCQQMDEDYEIRENLPGAFPLGDDGGALLYFHDGTQGPGIYIVDFGVLDTEGSTWVATSLSAILEEGSGMDVLTGGSGLR